MATVSRCSIIFDSTTLILKRANLNLVIRFLSLIQTQLLFLGASDHTSSFKSFVVLLVHVEEGLGDIRIGVV